MPYKKNLTPDVIMLFDLQSANAVTVSSHDLLNILSSIFIFTGKGKRCFFKCVYNGSQANIYSQQSVLKDVIVLFFCSIQLDK